MHFRAVVRFNQKGGEQEWEKNVYLIENGRNGTLLRNGTAAHFGLAAASNDLNTPEFLTRHFQVSRHDVFVLDAVAGVCEVYICGKITAVN